MSDCWGFPPAAQALAPPVLPHSVASATLARARAPATNSLCDRREVTGSLRFKQAFTETGKHCVHVTHGVLPAWVHRGTCTRRPVTATPAGKGVGRQAVATETRQATFLSISQGSTDVFPVSWQNRGSRQLFGARASPQRLQAGPAPRPHSGLLPRPAPPGAAGGGAVGGAPGSRPLQPGGQGSGGAEGGAGLVKAHSV